LLILYPVDTTIGRKIAGTVPAVLATDCLNEPEQVCLSATESVVTLFPLIEEVHKQDLLMASFSPSMGSGHSERGNVQERTEGTGERGRASADSGCYRGDLFATRPRTRGFFR
jgi:hypothetical protein